MKTSSGSIRLRRSRSAIRTLSDAGGLGQEIHPALRRTALDEVGAGHRGRQPERRIVLVELARLDDDDAERLARLGAGERDQVVRAQPAALDPAGGADPHVAREDGTGQPGRGAPARGDAKDLHAAGWLALVAS